MTTKIKTDTVPSAAVTMSIGILLDLRVRLIANAAILRLQLWKTAQYWNSEEGRIYAASEWCGEQDARVDFRERKEAELAELDSAIVSATDAIRNAGYVPTDMNDQSLRGTMILLASNVDLLVNDQDASYTHTANGLLRELTTCIECFNCRSDSRI
jgi:hypothetical protein